jgi:1-acyl-sn-glycerol-3-phosphate acyltransferase
LRSWLELCPSHFGSFGEAAQEKGSCWTRGSAHFENIVKPWVYESAEDLDRGIVERLRQFPREPDMLVYGMRSLAALALRSWLRTYHRLEIHGREHLPKEKSFVLVANHTSHLDTLCLLAALPLRKLHRAFPAAAADYFFESVPRIWLAAVVVNALPFGRQSHIKQSLALCQHLLENPGNLLIIFPEGTRSATGGIGKFKPGIGALVAGRDVPVLPCHLKGGFKAWPKGRIFPRPAKLQLTIGKPRSFATIAATREDAISIAAELEQAIKDMDHESH